MSNSIIKVEGIGKVYAEKLKKAGVTTSTAYLAQSTTPKDRKTLSEKTGIDETYILKWANLCDLMRIKGVGEEYSELLEAAGVDTVKELKHRNVENLTKALADANAKAKKVRSLPSAKLVAGWIDQAKKLPEVLKY